MYKFPSWSLGTHARSFSCFEGLRENPNILFPTKVWNSLRKKLKELQSETQI